MVAGAREVMVVARGRTEVTAVVATRLAASREAATPRPEEERAAGAVDARHQALLSIAG